MCGFCGFTGDTAEREAVIRRMMDTMRHRGPDDAGAYLGEGVSLGFLRLAIIGLADGAQPMTNEDGSVVCVYNGEIYNYQALRQSLTDRGHVFKTNADTEVLLHAYEEYGYDFLTRLRGMFAFALWDGNKRLLFGARDYFGIKPFYYARLGGELVFASEIKGLTQHPAFVPVLNEAALEHYLAFQYSVLPETFYQGVFALPPAHYFVYQDGEMTVQRYWEARFAADDALTFDAAAREVDAALQDSVQAHMVSDVEVGCFLSGGVDSSFIAASFPGAKTFTVGFESEKYSEIEHARALSARLGLAHYSQVITKDEYFAALPDILRRFDEPLADPSAVALYFVSRLAARHVKVALSGEGADELFGGYNIYREPLSLAPYARLPAGIRKGLAWLAARLPFAFKGKNFLIRAAKTVETRFIGNANIFTPRERAAIRKTPVRVGPPETLTRPFYDRVRGQDDVTKMQHIDLHFWLAGDILFKADRMSMAHSLELRPPFLDVEVFKAAARLPARYKVSRKGTKLLFRAVAAKRLPEETARRKKLGFPVPIREWLKEDETYQRVEQAFTRGAGAGYFNQPAILRLLAEHKRGKRDNSRKIWTLYIFLLWYAEVFEPLAA